MSCDCEYPDLYSSRQVKVRKPHKCIECGQIISAGQLAQKIDALCDGEFRSFYTCKECQELIDYLKGHYPEMDACCHGELHEALWDTDFVFSRKEIEELDSPKGRYQIIATHEPWLVLKEGNFRLSQESVKEMNLALSKPISSAEGTSTIRGGED